MDEQTTQVVKNYQDKRNKELQAGKDISRIIDWL